MNQYKAHRRTLWDVNSVAGTNTITGTVNTAFLEYSQVDLITFIPANNNTGAATININGMGAKDLKKNGHSTALGADDLVAGVSYVAHYDGTNYQIVSGALTGGGGGGSVTSVDFSIVNDDTRTVSGNPVTSSGTLTDTAVDAAADKVVGWDDSAGKKIYFTLGGGLTTSGTTLSSPSGTVTSVGLAKTNDDTISISGTPVTSSGTLSVDAVDPGADRLVMWDDSAGKKIYASLGTNISITGDTVNVTLDPSNVQRALVASDGTKTYGNVTSTSRNSEGVYTVTFSTAFGGANSYVAHATPENTTTGIAKGFSAGTTETFSGTLTPFFYISSIDEIWGCNYTTNLVHIYSVAGDTSSTYDPSNDISANSGNSCCLSKEGTLFWISGFDTNGQIIALDVSDKSEDVNLGTTGGFNDVVYAASSGMVIWHDGSAGQLKASTYTSSLGSTLSNLTIGKDATAPGVWDSDGNCYLPLSAGLVVVSSTGTSMVQHTYPLAPGAGTNTTPTAQGAFSNLVFDSKRNCIWMVLYENVDQLRRLWKWDIATESYEEWFLGPEQYWGSSIALDEENDILYVVTFSDFLTRYKFPEMALIDRIYVSDDLSADFDIGAGEDPWGEHKSLIFTPDGRIWAGGTSCLISFEYDGAELTVTNLTHATVGDRSTTTCKVYLYKSLSPIVRADGAFNFTASN